MEQQEGLETVEHLIQTTGLSVEDLLKQLQKYKALKHTKKPNDDSSIPTSSTNDEDSRDGSTETNNSTKKQESTGIAVAKDETETSADENSIEISSTTEHSSEKSKEEDHVESTEAIGDSKKKECEPSFSTLQVKSFAREKTVSDKVHKALLMDHDYDKNDEHSDSAPEDLDSVDSTSSFENMRDNIRLQLSFLRTKKKDDLPVLHTTEAVAMPLNASMKRKRRSEELDRPMLLDDIISLSDETEFMIMDVTGGVDRVVEDDCKKQEKPEEEKTKNGEKEQEGEKMVDKDEKKEDEDEKVEAKIEEGQEERKKVEEQKSEVIETILSIRKRKKRLYTRESPKKLKLDEVNAEFAETALERQTPDNLDEEPAPGKKLATESPFVSNMLDKFLNEDLKLNVSYPIPKLGAEEGIKNTPQSVFDRMEPEARSGLLQQQHVAYKRKHNIKAKTLAEMRRQMGLTKGKETIKSPNPKAPKQEVHDADVKAAIKSEVKQETEDDNKEEEREEVVNPEALKQKASKLVKEENRKIVLTMRKRRLSFVMYGKRMLWLPSFSSEKCIGKVEVFQERPKPNIDDSKTEPHKVVKPSHISILSPVLKAPTSKLSKYKPGPLCKKRHLLQNDNWTVEMKKMPEVYMEVVPEVGKPINHEIEHFLPLHENIISEARATFALSMLKESNRTVFKMIVPYEDNRDEVLVRKQKVISTVSKPVQCDDPSVAVKSVLDGLLDFVERKEDFDKVVEKYDDEVIDNENTQMSKDEKSSSPGEKKGRRRRTIRTKVDLELLRLNCKIIDVQENVKEEKACEKLPCRLGCVCKSLACDGVFSAHCQLVECMFDCTCPLPVNLSDKLSTYTLNHLDGEAKKNLAKVEREFTQTIIHAGNDTIVMGAGGRDKARRSCKQPKKYSDFVQTNLVACDKEDETWNLLQEKFKLKKCSVDVPMMELNSAVPLCIVHGKYSCWCNGMVVPMTKKKKPPPEKTEIKPVKMENKPSNKIPVEQHNEPVETPPVMKSTTALVTTVMPTPTLPTFSEDSCARLREVTSAYRLRNKTVLHFKEIVEFVDDRILKITHVDDDKRHSKRKQSFAVREEVNAVQDEKLYRQMQKVIAKEKKFRSKIPKEDSKIFEEEIKIPLSNNLNAEMVQIIGEENAELSLLPWEALMRNFKSGSWTVWCLKSDPKKMICTKTGFEPPNRSEFANIQTRLYSTPVIDWILNDKLPENKPVDRVHFLLVKLDENNFEVKGVCMKNSVGISGTLDVPERIETITRIEPKKIKTTKIRCKRKEEPTQEPGAEIPGEESTEERKMPTLERMDVMPRPQSALKKMTLPSNRSLRCSHKNVNGETKCLTLLNRPFDLRSIRPIDQSDSTLVFDVPLPRIGVASKWLLVYLNSDFSYLNFTVSQYSIKYNDLMDVVTMAKNLEKTIILRNNEFTKTYINISFGIFCVPSFQDRLFIGPFARSEEPNVETLRFMHGSLVNTFLFNQMRGRVDAKSSVFMEEVEVLRKSGKIANAPRDAPVLKPATVSKPIIPMRRVPTSSKLMPANIPPSLLSRFDETFFFTLPFILGIKNITQDLPKPNRVVVTNIPHFGYLLAYQHVKHFDLYWPDSNNAYRFQSAAFAKEVLKCYLHNVFCTVPESFKINIVIMTTVNDPKSEICRYLETHCQWFVGDFGICKMSNPSADALAIYGINKLKSRATCPKRLDENVSMIIRLFGLLFLPEECLSDLSVEQILFKVNDKITEMEDPDGDFGNERTALLRMIEQSKVKLHRLDKVGSLPVGSNKEEAPKPAIVIPETIEITDSDDEDSSTTENKSVTLTQSAAPAFKRILQSGKIQQGESTSLLKTTQRIFPKPSASLVSLLKNTEVKVLTTNGVALKLKVKDVDLAGSSQNGDEPT